jgi:hypothetical protein
MGIPSLAINHVYSEQTSNVSENFSTSIIRESFQVYPNSATTPYLHITLTAMVKEEIYVRNARNIYSK